MRIDATLRDIACLYRPIFFNLCSVYVEDSTIGNSWRIANDVNNWIDIMNAANCNEALGNRAGPGGFNDPGQWRGERGDTVGDALVFSGQRAPHAGTCRRAGDASRHSLCMAASITEHHISKHASRRIK